MHFHTEKIKFLIAFDFVLGSVVTFIEHCDFISRRRVEVCILNEKNTTLNMWAFYEERKKI